MYGRRSKKLRDNLDLAAIDDRDQSAVLDLAEAPRTARSQHTESHFSTIT